MPGLPRWLTGKESACQYRRCRGHGFDPWVGKIPWRRKWQPTPVFSPGKFHGQRSLAGYNPWSHKVVECSGKLKCPALRWTTWFRVGCCCPTGTMTPNGSHFFPLATAVSTSYHCHPPSVPTSISDPSSCQRCTVDKGKWTVLTWLNEWVKEGSPEACLILSGLKSFPSISFSSSLV